MSGHGRREVILMANATRWCDAVMRDTRSEAGRVARREHRVSYVSIEQLTRVIAGYVGRGEPTVSLKDVLERTENGDLRPLPLSERRGRRLLKFLVARGHVTATGDLIQPVGLGELL